MFSYIISWLFGIAVFIDGILNLYRGNDPGLGVAFLVLSFVYYPPVNDFISKRFGLSIHYLIKIVLGILIIWVTLAVGAIAEGYY
ncbi:MAG: hypothetical protein P8100_14930 [bacterium]|jgi:hypothetical protein